MSINIKLTSRYILFVIYDDESQYPSTNKHVMEKTVIFEENIFQLNLARKFEKLSDLSLFGHKCD